MMSNCAKMANLENVTSFELFFTPSKAASVRYSWGYSTEHSP